MVSRVDGPFDYFKDKYAGTTGDTIRQSADDNSRYTEALATLSDDLDGDGKRVIDTTEGEAQLTAQNATNSQEAADRLYRNGEFAMGCIRLFASTVDTFDGAVNRINTDYHNRVQAITTGIIHDPDYRSGEVDVDWSQIRSDVKGDFVGEYKQAEGELDDGADDVQAKLDAGATPGSVKDLIMAGMIPFGAAGRYPDVSLTTAEKYDAYRAEVKAGNAPDFADMTEAERQAFADDHPEILRYLMKLDSPSQQQQDDVIALALPHVNMADAKGDSSSIIGALDNGMPPESLQQGFENSQAISEGMELLAPWLAKHNLDASDNPVAQNVNGYLKEFAEQTWPRHNDIVDYITSDDLWDKFPHMTEQGHVHTEDEAITFSASEQRNMLEAFSNNFLHLSNENVGGSWDDLPSDFRAAADELPHTDTIIGAGSSVNTIEPNDDFKDLARFLANGDAAAGDDLSKHLGATAATSVSMWDAFNEKSAGQDSMGQWGDDVAGDVFDLVSRNHSATTDLLTGNNVPDNYAPAFGHAWYDQADNFNQVLFGHDWSSETEHKVAHMYDWMHEAQLDGADDDALAGQIADANRADRAFNAVVEGLTDPADDGFKNLMGPDGASAAENNPVLANTLVNQLGDHLDEFSRQEDTAGAGPLDEGARVRFMTLLASNDDSADRLAASITANQQDTINDWLKSDKDEDGDSPKDHVNDVADRNSRLSTYLDASLFNSAQEKVHNDRLAEEARIDHIETGMDIVASLATLGPTGSGAGAGISQSILEQVLEADMQEFHDPSSAVRPDWNANGGHVTTTNYLQMMGALEQSGRIDSEDIPEELLHPENLSDAQIQDAARQMLDEAFPGQDLADTYGTAAKHNYSSDLGNLSLQGKGEQQTKDFLTSPEWP